MLKCNSRQIAIAAVLIVMAGFALVSLRPAAQGVVEQRPQQPRPPFPYQTHEVSVETSASVLLAGTLSLPEGNGPFPAVLLITGAGAQDRDETIFGHKPFLVLADYLTRHGLAVLRLDDRGTGESTGSFAGATAAEMVDDVVHAVRFLAGHAAVDATQIGLLGHSEGGAIGPLAVLQSDVSVRFLVLLAAPGRPFEEILRQQDRDFARVAGVSPEDRDRHESLQRQLFQIILEQGDTEQARDQARDVMRASVADLTEEEQAALGATEDVMEQQIGFMFSNVFRRFLGHDPVPVLREIQIPVLALNGAKDLQVAAEDNLSAIEAALTEAGNDDFETAVVPGLNHLFQHCETGATSEYQRIRETFDPATLQRIGDWILGRCEVSQALDSRR